MRDNAKFLDHYLYDTYLESYLLRDIHKHTGISFDDFLNRPRYRIEKMLKVLEVFQKRESTDAGKLLDKLSNQNKS